MSELTLARSTLADVLTQTPQDPVALRSAILATHTMLSVHLSNAKPEPIKVSVKKSLEGCWAAPLASFQPSDQQYVYCIYGFLTASKITAIKALREYSNIGLKDAKDIVDNLPQWPGYRSLELVKLAGQDKAAADEVPF